MKVLCRCIYCFLLACLMMVPSGIFAQVTNGMNASNVVGQTSDSEPNAPYYTKGGMWDSPNGKGLYNPMGVVLDDVHHRLFVADSSIDRILIYNLNADNTISSYKADFVLGQPDLLTGPSQGKKEAPSTPPTRSNLRSPSGLALDPVRNLLFVADRNYNRIMIFDVETITNGEEAVAVLGQSDFVSSSGITSDTGLLGPYGLTYDSDDKLLFVVDTGNTRVLVFDVGDIENGKAASYVLGQTDFSSNNYGTTQSVMKYPVNATYFSQPGPKKYLAVSDEGNGRVLIFDITTTIENGMNAWRVIGQPDFVSSGIYCAQGRLASPAALAYDSVHKKMAVGDVGNWRVVIFDFSTITNGMNAEHVLGQTDLSTCDSHYPVSATSITNPMGIAWDSVNQRLFMSDSSFERVVVFNGMDTISDGAAPSEVLGQTDTLSNPVPSFTKGSPYNGPNERGISGETSVAVDSVHHRLFIADSSDHRILVFNLSTDNELTDYAADNVLGQPDFDSNEGGTARNKFNSPLGIAYDPDGNRLFVCDNQNSRILVFDVESITNNEDAIYVLGQSDFVSSSVISPPTQTSLSYPRVVTYDSIHKRLFVADSDNFRILVYDLSSGIENGQAASYVLGQPDFVTGDYPSSITSKTVFVARGLAYDENSDRLFVADPDSNRVLIFDLHSSISNYQEAAYVLGQADFTTGNFVSISQSSLDAPFGLAYDQVEKRLFVADGDSNRVMVFDVATITNGEEAVNVIGQSDFTSQTTGRTQSTLNDIDGVAIDASASYLYVSDLKNYRVMVFRITNAPLPTATPTVTPTPEPTNTPSPTVPPSITPTPTATPPAGTITGRILDANGNPIVGAVVFSDELGTVLTDENGYYVFSGAKANRNYLLVVTSSAYSFGSREISVTTGSQASAVAPDLRAGSNNSVPASCTSKSLAEKLSVLAENARMINEYGNAIAEKLRPSLSKADRKTLEHRLNIMNGAYLQNMRSVETLASITMTCPKSYSCQRTRHTRKLNNSEMDYWNLNANISILGQELSLRRPALKAWAQRQVSKARSLYTKSLKVLKSYPQATVFCRAES